MYNSCTWQICCFGDIGHFDEPAERKKKKSCQIEYKLLYKMYFRIISLTLQCLLSEENNSNQKEKNGEVDRLKKVF